LSFTIDSVLYFTDKISYNNANSAVPKHQKKQIANFELNYNGDDASSFQTSEKVQNGEEEEIFRFQAFSESKV